MCGIVYQKSLTGLPVSSNILEQFEKQKSRGVEGFGFFLPQTNKMTHNTRLGRIVRKLKKSRSSEILFHHRLPTSTPNVRNSCHPFSTKDKFSKNYVLVHNGVVSNSRSLKTEHNELGIEYVSEYDNKFNDSEALLYDVALYLEGKQDKLKATGSIAFIAVELENGVAKKLHFGRNSSPLNMNFTPEEITLSSEGEGVAIEPHKLYSYEYSSGKLETTPLDIGYNYKKYEKTSTTTEMCSVEDVIENVITQESELQEELWGKELNDGVIDSIQRTAMDIIATYRDTFKADDEDVLDNLYDDRGEILGQLDDLSLTGDRPTNEDEWYRYYERQDLLDDLRVIDTAIGIMEGVLGYDY